MSWVEVKRNCLKYLQILCIKILMYFVRVPSHIAIIMDGNRRFAKRANVKTNIGHSKGSDRFDETVKWCLRLGVRELTVFAFSIENFKRCDEEVNALMDLGRDKFRRLMADIAKLNTMKIRIEVVGRVSMLPRDLRVLVSQVMSATKHNSRLKVNIAVAYTGRDEISRGITRILDAVHNDELTATDIDEDLISISVDVAEPELLIRTSGEVRLSDFMLWQVSNTALYFTEVLWPDFTVWNLLKAIIYFNKCTTNFNLKTENSTATKLVKSLQKTRRQNMKNLMDF